KDFSSASNTLSIVSPALISTYLAARAAVRQKRENVAAAACDSRSRWDWTTRLTGDGGPACRGAKCSDDEQPLLNHPQSRHRPPSLTHTHTPRTAKVTDLRNPPQMPSCSLLYTLQGDVTTGDTVCLNVADTFSSVQADGSGSQEEDRPRLRRHVLSSEFSACQNTKHTAN
ncbi:hypothetical protein KUCAC02_033156, partial [Chaenocephalus aceratus]